MLTRSLISSTYDMKGVVLVQTQLRVLLTSTRLVVFGTDQGEPDTTYGNLSKTPIVSENNYIQLTTTANRVRTLMMNM